MLAHLHETLTPFLQKQKSDMTAQKTQIKQLNDSSRATSLPSLS